MMITNRYIVYLVIAALVSWLAFYLVLNRLDPFVNNNITTVAGLSLAMFFVSLFFALTSTFTILGFYIRVWFNKNEVYFDHLNVSLRQAVFLSLIALGSILFQILGVLSWWSGLLLIGSVVAIEAYLLSK